MDKNKKQERLKKSISNICSKYKIKCITKNVPDTYIKLEWQCSKSKHKWNEALRKIKERTKKFDKVICSQCHEEEKKREHFSLCQKAVKEKNGKMVSKAYIDSKTHLQVKCKEGHQWGVTSSNLLKGKWCPYCAGQKGITIKDFEKIAKSHNGKCLSKKYLNNKTKLKFECSEGHKFSAIPSNVKKGHWCEKCSIKKRSGTRKYSIDDIKKIANSKAGKCLSKELKSLDDYIKLECNKGHIWQTKAKNILHKGSWCIYCASNSAVNIEDIKQHCNSFGFKLISKKYESNKKLTIKCQVGHRFDIRWSNLRKGRGCPECSQGIGERVCRETLQEIFKKKFPRQKPEWLTTKSGTRLELDGYNEELKIAFEHQGQQHYTHNAFYHKDKSKFKKRLKYDDLKRKRCKQQKVILIEIPEVGSLTPIKDVPTFITNELIKNKIKVPKKSQNLKIEDIKKAFSSTYEINELKELAIKYNLKVKDKVWFGTHAKYEFQCVKCKHSWKTSVYFLTDKRRKFNGCPKCTGNHGQLGSTFNSPRQKWTIELARKELKKQNYELISKQFRTMDEKYKYKCPKGHIWEANFYSVTKDKTGCSVCYKEKYKNDLEKKIKGSGLEIKKFEKGYVTFKCKNNHTFRRTNNWCLTNKHCPTCKEDMYKKQLTKEFLNAIKKNSGKTRVKNIKSVMQRYKVTCKNNHSFEASIRSIRDGNWCPKCRVKKPKKHSLESVRAYSNELGLKLLSKEYQNTNQKLKFKCSKGHTFEKSYTKLKSGQLCPICKMKELGRSY